VRPSALLVGGSRGLGAALRPLLAQAYDLVWTSRDQDATRAEGEHHLLHLEDSSSRDSLADRIRDSVRPQRFGLVVFCAAKTGVTSSTQDSILGGPLSDVDFHETLEVNCFAPLKIAQRLVEAGLVQAGSKIVFLSSASGSISLRGTLSHHQRGGPAVYRISKAALNAGIRSLAFDLQPSRITVVALHPGWIRTNSETAGASTAAEDAAQTISRLVESIDFSDSGKFLDSTGRQIPW